MEDAPRLMQAVGCYDKVFTIVENGTGFYRDGSLLLHHNFPYNGHYGTYAVLNKLMPVLTVLSGTPFQPAEASLPQNMLRNN